MSQAFSTIPTRTNGPPQVDAAWWNILRDAGVTVETNGSVWTKYTVAHTALQTAGLTNNITLLTLGIKEVIQAIVVKHSIAFAGTSITAYEVGVGIATDLSKYAGPYDVFQAVADGTKLSSNTMDLESFTGTTAIKISATSVGGNLSASTAGSVDIWVLKSTLP